MTTATRTLWVVIAVLLAPSVAAAGDNPYLTAGLRLYQDFELEAAREQLEKAQRAPDNTPEQDVTINVYLGLTLMGLGDESGAEQAFLKALALDPDRQLPPESTPATRELFENVRARVVATHGTLPSISGPPEPVQEPVQEPAQEPAPPEEQSTSEVTTEAASADNAAQPVAVRTVERGAGLPWAVPIATAAAGVTTLVAGIVVGAAAKGNADRAPDVYGGQLLAQQAQGQATVANVLIAVGGALAAAGGVMCLFSGEEPLVAALAPVASGHGVAFSLQGAF